MWQRSLNSLYSIRKLSDAIYVIQASFLGSSLTCSLHPTEFSLSLKHTILSYHEGGGPFIIPVINLDRDALQSLAEHF